MGNRLVRVAVVLAALLPTQSPAAEGAVEGLLADYRQAGASGFDRLRGEEIWRRERQVEGKVRSCGVCHGSDLTEAGAHVRTGKPIEPLAPSVNRARLTERAEISKWLLRNCKWTLGRECDPQEKGDLLLYLQSQ